MDDPAKLVNREIKRLKKKPYSFFCKWMEESREEVRDVSTGEYKSQLTIQVMWDDKKKGTIRVAVDLHDPHKSKLKFLPIWRPIAIESFIIAPDGTFVGE